MFSKTHLNIFDIDTNTVDSRYEINKVVGLDQYLPTFCGVELSMPTSPMRALFACKQHQTQQILSNYEE